MISSNKPRVELLVTDLDNTVWDWFDAWYKSFTALLTALHEDTLIPVAVLERGIRRIHQARFTSEYSWLIEELDLLAPFVRQGQDVRARFDSALHRQNSARKHATHAYPGVIETMRTIKASGVPIIAYTESLAFWTRWRIKQVGLDGLLDRLYTSPDHDAPHGLDVNEKRKLPAANYELKATEHRHVPAGIVKPDPHILGQIMSEYGVDASRVAYVGDSLMKDVEMAQKVGAFDVYARYGDSHLDPRYAQLQRVSHWPDLAVAREQSGFAQGAPIPRYTLNRDLGQLLDCFEFGPKA